jgi:hypothetical protein
MGDEMFLLLLKPFPLCRDFNHSPRDRALDLKFCETLSLKSLPFPQSCSVEDAKSATTGAIYFLANGIVERNSLANQLPRP